MGHGIEIFVEDGIERASFAFAGERPWHGLGVRVGESGDADVSLREIERAARADWRVVVDGVKTATDGADIDGVHPRHRLSRRCILPALDEAPMDDERE